MDDALDFGCRRRQKLRYFEAGRRSTLRHSELLYTTRAVILVGIVQCSEKQTDSIFKLKSQQYGNIWAWCRKCLNSAGTIEFRRLFLDTGLIILWMVNLCLGPVQFSFYRWSVDCVTPYQLSWTGLRLNMGNYTMVSLDRPISIVLSNRGWYNSAC